MQYKTSSSHFKKYGSVYEHPISLEETGMISRGAEATAKKTISQVYSFDCEVYLEMKSGMAALIVSETPEADTFEAFAIHRFIRLKPHIIMFIFNVYCLLCKC